MLPSLVERFAPWALAVAVLATSLATEQLVLADQARAAERTRIAREMHDVVARQVTLMVPEAGALQVKAAGEGTAATAARIRRSGQEALVELRQVLGALRTTRDEDGLGHVPRSGWGLVGLTERARLLGGTLDAGPTDEGGFLVRAELPR
jgi:signal transduction histidine kinase